MSARLSRHLAGNAVAYIALFFAITLGTAWALEANSVKSKHIVDGQVKNKDLAGVEVLKSTGDVSLQDGPGPSETTEELADVAGFTFTAVCNQDPASTMRASIEVTPDTAGPFWSFDSTAPNGVDDETLLGTSDTPELIVVGPTTGSHYDTGTWSIRRGDGTSLQGMATAATLDNGAFCRFGLTVLG